MKHNYYSLLFIPLILSCGSCTKPVKTISGKWETINVTNIMSSNKESVAPFNTTMMLRYIVQENDDLNMIDDISTIFNDTIKSLHKKFDRHCSYYNEDNELINNVKTINDSYGTNKPVKCSNELYELLKDSVEYMQLSEGKFNIFIGGITDYWDDIFDNAYNYTPLSEIDPYYDDNQKEKLDNLIKAVPLTQEAIANQLTFNDEAKEITFNALDDFGDYRPYITVGGIAKGLATDIAKQELLNHNYKYGYIIGGGSSITTLSDPIYTSNKDGQKISVVDPINYNPLSNEGAFSIRVNKDCNFSTSGNYTTNKSYSFIDSNNNIIYRHHIVNPSTGYPESYHRSVSILSHTFNNAILDVFSTTLMNMTVEEGMEFRKEILKKYPENDLEIMYLDQEGYRTEGKLTVNASSSINNTLTAKEGVQVKYYE